MAKQRLAVAVVHGPESPLPSARASLSDDFEVDLLPPDALDRLVADQAWVIELAALSDKSWERVAMSRPDGRGVVLVGGRELKPRLLSLFETGRLRHLLGCDRAINVHDLHVTLTKLISPGEAGLDPYLAKDLKRRRHTVTRASQKRDMISAAASFAAEAKVNSRFQASFCTIAEELVTNAVYNAPVDEHGQRRYAHLSRDVEVEFEREQALVVEMGFDGRRLALSAKDAFGSLTVERTQQAMARALKKGQGQINTKPGGAGIGLAYTLELVSHFVINIEPNVATEMIGIIDVMSSYREWAVKPKSFNVFCAEGH